MTRGERGYTVAEMLTVLAIFGIVLTLTSFTFNRIVSNSTRVMKSEQTEIEGMIGLEVLRIDLENAGLGLPWSYRSTGWSGYAEAKSDTPAAGFNEIADAGTGQFQAPRGIIVASGDRETESESGTHDPSCHMNHSDYLVLKGTALGTTRSARKWSYLTYGNTSSAVFKPSRGENELASGEEPDGSTAPNGGPWVIVLKDTAKDGVVGKELVMDGSSFVTRFNGNLSQAFIPQRPQDHHVVYGVHDYSPKASTNAKPVRPFNRADYYINASDAPLARCAHGTGTLFKKVLDVDDGGFGTVYPLLDCVADLQVVVGLDSNYDGDIDSYVDDLTPPAYDAQAIRDQVKEIRVYILAQDGVRDAGYLHPYEKADRAVVVGEHVARFWSKTEMEATFGVDWRHYRWKVFRLVVQPKNLQ